MTDVGSYMWTQAVPGAAVSPVVHRVASVEKGWTPTDNEAEEYRAVCGIFGRDWSMPAQGIRGFGTGKEFPQGRIRCWGCFPEASDPILV